MAVPGSGATPASPRTASLAHIPLPVIRVLSTDDGGKTVTWYMVSGHEEFPVLYLRPVDNEQGVELPEALYRRWQRTRAELDAVQRDVVAYVRVNAGSDAIPLALRDRHDHPRGEPPSDRAWNLS